MIDHRFKRTLAPSALAATLVGSIVTSAEAVPLPVTSAQNIAGAAATEQVQWWGGRGWGWRRSYYGGGALAAGLIGGLALGTLAASAGSYYGYGYPYYGYSYPSYYGSGYGYYPSSYAYPAYSYVLPVFLRVPILLLVSRLLWERVLRRLVWRGLRERLLGFGQAPP